MLYVLVMKDPPGALNDIGAHLVHIIWMVPIVFVFPFCIYYSLTCLLYYPWKAL